jgi:class 3 adenylate cyclase
MADVSGFTSLAERLAAQGPDGVEALSRLVNRWFGAMVDVIEAHGGDIIRFAGDAPIVAFPVEDSGNGLRDAVRRAVACGRALRQTMRDLRSPDADVNIRVGIGAGTVTMVIAGGIAGRWEFVLGGSPIAQMAEAERRAAPGELVLSTEAEAVLGDAQAPAPDFGPLAAPPVDDAAARPFVPRSVLHFIDAGQTAWTAELRQVTVLFLGIRGIDLDTPADAMRVHDALGRLQTAVFDQDGSVSQFLVDDKGLTLVASWGASGHRHEDDAVRAVRAALAGHATLAAAGVTARCGLASGRVFCGWRGNERRREYALIGAVVNRAARLMMATADDLRCDAETARAGAAAGRYEDTGLLALKGSPQPTQTFRPTGVSGPAGLTLGTAAPGTPEAPEMIGRQAEREVLTSALARLHTGTSMTVVIRGDAGMGKSTLIADFLRMARLAQATVAFGSVESASGTGPYGPWRTILSTVLELDRVAGTDGRTIALLNLLDRLPDVTDFAPLLAEVLGLPLADTERTGHIVQQARVEKTRDLVVDLLQGAASAAPLVVVLDNVHWMDSLSVALARAAQRRVSPLLLILVTRPFGTEPPGEVTELFGAADHVLDLARLGPDDVRRLICRRLGVTHVPDELTSIVEQKAAGYPLFVGELVGSLRDAGVIQTSGSACVLTDNGARLRSHRFPDSVQGAIADRLDRMGAAEQLTMKVASAVGAPFDAETIAVVHPMRPGQEELDRLLAELIGRGFLVPRDGTDYDFGHAVMQDVAYSLMLSEQRRGLHRAIGEWYETPRSRDVPAAVMAHHWTEAEDEERSLHWLERAGEDASRIGAFQETLRHLGRAFDLASRASVAPVEPLRRIRWLRLSGHAHSELGAMDESTRRLQSALELIGGRLPGSGPAMGARLFRETVRQAGLLSGILRAPARLSPAARRRTLEEAEVLRLIGKVAFYAQDHLRYLTVSLQSINLAERAGARETAASAYAALGYVVAMFGLERLARRWWRLADDSGELDAQLNGLIGQMMFLNSNARWNESLRCADQQAALIARLGTSTSMPSHLMMRGYIDLHHGRYDSALAHVNQLLHWCLSVSHLQQGFATHLQLCGVLLEQGRVDEARRHLADADALSSEVADPLFLTIYHGVAVSVQLLAGDLAGARAPAEALRAVIAGSSPYFGDMTGYVAMTEYFLAVHHDAAPGAGADALLADARWAHAALKKHASMNPYARPRTWLLDGRIAAANRQFARAHRSWQRALALAERYDMPREIARAHADLGQLSRLRSTDRRAHLLEARTRFERMGSPHLAAAAAQALDRLSQALEQPALGA